MKIISNIDEMRLYAARLVKRGHSIGFVPTMGALHAGHISLVDAAAAADAKVIVSVFVNQVQFAPNEDFNAYPRPIKKDIKLLRSTKKVDCLFTPEAAEMYPEGYASHVALENSMTACLCGVTRPAHFKGVTTVIAKFLNIVNPDRIYLGQKDAQQAMIIIKMMRDLNYRTQAVICPIVREKDGLALSSRNAYLTPEQRNSAPVIFKSLQMVESMVELGERNAETIKKEIRRKIKEENLEIDYVEAVSAADLKPAEQLSGKVLIAAAVFVGKTRLIDNIIIDIP
jgi:pantoate--beta-alanine ligase